MVRAVQSNVHEWCGGPEDARQMGATHDAVRCAAALQQGVNIRVVPTVMAELDGDANPLRKRGQEVVEPGVVALKIRWKIRSTQTSGL